MIWFGFSVFDVLVQISVFCKFHDDGDGEQSSIAPRDKELFVSDYVGVEAGLNDIDLVENAITIRLKMYLSRSTIS